ncbi:unnamed protein product [Eruca vesicaria subsp. sativa]|uniref:Uncharacterized protein n=1 Tax=Eruca vesicaria subsp. sativa TaxID=29727 RepID=A0ABC8JC15_ERUVS|nr:unnamed protein product [Eruca vesicaria subsp. sativa]
MIYRTGKRDRHARFANKEQEDQAKFWTQNQASFLLLSSVGGTADRCICFPSPTTTSINTCSHVCNLAWSKNINKLIAKELRFMFLAVSPDGKTNENGAGDETLRFWNVFPSMKAQKRH